MMLNKTTSYRIYDQNGLYFITFSTVGWIDLFTRKEYKDLLIDSLAYCQEKKGLSIFAFVIMTNHIHLIVRARKGHKLSEILRDFKRHTSKRLLALINQQGESRREWLESLLQKAADETSKNNISKVWRNDNHPIELYSSAVIDQKLEYIHFNPVKEGIVDSPKNYVYSSAYCGQARPNVNLESLYW